MKNTMKVFGIIALAAVIGFSLAACSSSGGGSSTYMGAFGVFQNTIYKARSGITPASSLQTSGGLGMSKSACISLFDNLEGWNEPGTGDEGEGQSLSEIKEGLAMLVDGGALTTDEKDKILSELSSKGYVAAVKIIPASATAASPYNNGRYCAAIGVAKE